MISFWVALICLVLGYFIYGAFVEKVFRPQSDKKTLCYTRSDGVDSIPLPTWKVFLIQFLNIAGTGPIFGAIMGILFGPAAYLWIVLGCIFAGSVHDYLSGMLSLRMGGISLPEIVGSQLGPFMRNVMRLCAMLLMLLVGAVFVTTPAGLLADMSSSWGSWASTTLWSVLIFVYYILATLLPINQLIGRIYPLFGIALLIMALGVGYGVITQEGWMPEITDGIVSTHPKGYPVLPMLCITIACGALSGFHATQSPMMARCLKNECLGRRVFYGAMITEGMVALIWAAAAIKFAGSYEKLIAIGDPAVIVNEICKNWMGVVGAILAILGVVAAPITSGDTAFRSARLIAADMFHIRQDKLRQRLYLSLPIFLLSAVLMVIDFAILWRYFAWFNQMLGTITLWTLSVWLYKEKKCYWVALVPACFMTFVVTSYILVAPEGFALSYLVSYLASIICIVVLLTLFFFKQRRSLRISTTENT